ncbi:MAG: DEAD/DEAH box helicase [Syntrophomonadaceae bacterium]|nr:DEAD/DEAH box helicase [Syntrophomonadaceae bacterium]
MPIYIPEDIEEQINILRDGTNDKVNAAKVYYLRKQFANDFSFEEPVISNFNDLKTAATGLETVGFDLMSRYYKRPQVSKNSWENLIWPAFRIRRSLVLAKQNDLENLVNQVFDGLSANRQPEIRYELQSYNLDGPGVEVNTVDWDKYLYLEIIRAFLLLVRKNSGYNDLLKALTIIDGLHKIQLKVEKQYLSTNDNQNELQQKVVMIIALYNLAKIVELTGQYLCGEFAKKTSGTFSAKGIKGEIDRYVQNARDTLSGGYDPQLRIFANRLGEGCKALVESSIFSVVMPSRTKKFLLDLSQDDNQPVMELWYSQREALNQSLLDPTKSATVISMPTSAGKTLLAELAILEAYHNDPDSRIVYLAPTRALVSQVNLTLKRHLGKYLKIRIATPVFDLDPIEDEMLKENFHILITTPEKMDLLVKVDHEAIRNLSLVVVDEAHNMNDKGRGATLELLLATLRRERPVTRYLLLTPFAENAMDVSYWLGEEKGNPIVIDWKPNDRIVGTVKPGKKLRNKPLRGIIFETLESVHSDYPAGEPIDLGLYSIKEKDITTKEQLALRLALSWEKARNGGVLLLASSRPKAEKRAQWLTFQLPERPLSKSVDIVCRYLEAEMGQGIPLIEMLKKGVAYHHAGLSPEARYFIERLVEDREIKILCATTTLAQGVNFPLSVAIIEDHFRRIRKYGGNWIVEELEPWEFWNIAGRVGRTFEDSLGIVTFVNTNNEQKSKIQDYLNNDNFEISSALMGLLTGLKGQTNISFNSYLLNEVKSASAFLQYIVHALASTSLNKVRNDVEGILRASFVYEQARSEDPKLAEDLIRITRIYLDQLEASKGNALQGFAKLADGTGFSSPSVDIIMRNWKYEDKYRETDWNPDTLFSETGVSDTLVSAIVTMSEIPEIRLGSEDQGSFDPERIARITSRWVNGTPLYEIAHDEYGGDVVKCIQHIYSKISNLIPWGIRGIQKVSLAGDESVDWETADLIPAMIYHGVRSKEAIALRMLNVPRLAAEGLAKQWQSEDGVSVRNASDWLNGLDDSHWGKALRKKSPIKGSECKLLWEILEGKKNWATINE